MNISLNLPDALRGQFDALQQRLWRMETLAAVFGGGCGIFASYLLLFFSDRLWDTPPWLRFGITATGAGIFAWVAARWIRECIWKRPDAQTLAKLVQKHHRGLGDRLLGIVELADERKRPSNVSPALCRAAIKQVATEAAQFDFQKAVSTQRPKNCATGIACLGVLVAATWLLVPQAGWNALMRWLLPTSSIARYTFITLEDLPKEMIVPHGEPFEIPCSLNYRSFWRPTRAYGQYDRQPPIQASVRGSQVLFRIPGQTQKGVLTLRIGDEARRIGVIPTLRPELKQLLARVEKPAYLYHPTEEDDVRGGSLDVLEGSRVKFRGKASRLLATAGMNAGKPVPLTVRSDEFESSSLEPGGVAQCAFTWKDRLGLTAAAPRTLTVQTHKDLPPQTRCPDLAAATAILENEALEIRMTAQDDYGVRRLGASWEYNSQQHRTNSVVRQEVKLAEGTPRDVKLAETLRFSPAILRIPADTVVSLRALALDYYPGRKPSESPMHRIYVLGREEHARLIQQNFEALLAKLEELIQKQETLSGETRQTRELPDEKLKSETASRELGEQAAEESERSEDLKRLAQEWTKALREALRNPDLSEETLLEWARNLQAMRDLAHGEMQDATQALRNSQQNPAGRAGHVDRALELEQSVLRALQQMQAQMNEHLEQMQAKNLGQRLRKIARDEKQIVNTLQKMLPETIGLLPSEMPAEHKEAAETMSGRQERSQKEAGRLQEEILQFFHRTKQTRYGDVSREMTETRAVEEMSQISEKIRQNVSVQAMQQADGSARNFERWAEKLNSRDRSRSTSDMPMASMPKEEQERMLRRMQQALKLMRILQQEQSLREETQSLEAEKSKRENYPEESRKLAERQRQLMDDARRLQQEDLPSSLKDRLGQACDAMSQAGSLLDKPQTDDATVASETRAIDLLSSMIQMCAAEAQGAGACNGMALLLQMMGFGMGNGEGDQGGGSAAGGVTDRSNIRPAGNAQGTAPDSRSVERASGRASSSLPAEFRDVLQSYFDAMDQENP
ncbi:MAG: hypothetical protein HY360_05520 [Verrucomicrobia bacterium]|nr:hypothetical protein [Verrucomicrobiota bacterium]